MNARILSIALTTLCIPLATPARAEGPATSDQGVLDTVERELRYDPAIRPDAIDVACSDGIVDLTGEVDNLLAKERAARVAETVKGVRSVVNRIRVQPSEARSDETVRTDVMAALLTDPATDSYEVAVSVHDGAVTLSGTVESWKEKELCGTVSKGVDGVVSLQNNLSVEYAVDRPDSEIENEIRRSLRWNALVDDALVGVSVHDGRVVLTGTVGSAAEKTRARNEAWTSGVSEVDDSGLTVARWARDPDLRKDKYDDATDEEIALAVEDALADDPRVFSFDVATTVEDRVVTLRGVVDNLKAKRAAGMDASNTVGVLFVENYLKVRPVSGPSDAAVATNVRSALLRDPYVDQYQIDVDVEGGVVYLKGSVDSYFERAQADDVAARILGTVAVVNDLRVDDGPYAGDPYVDRWDMYDYDWYRNAPAYGLVSDLQLERDVERELFWSPFVDADDVEVDADDGIVTLQGTVDSWMESGAARDNAYEAGASYVRNELVVDEGGESSS